MTIKYTPSVSADVSPAFNEDKKQFQVQTRAFLDSLSSEITVLRDELNERIAKHQTMLGDTDVETVVDQWVKRIAAQFAEHPLLAHLNNSLVCGHGEFVMIGSRDFIGTPDALIARVKEDDEYRPINDLEEHLAHLIKGESLFNKPDAAAWLKSLRDQGDHLADKTTICVGLNLDLNEDDGDNKQLLLEIEHDWNSDFQLHDLLMSANHLYLDCQVIVDKINELAMISNQLREALHDISLIREPGASCIGPIEMPDGSHL